MKKAQQANMWRSWASLLLAMLDALTLISLLLTIAIIYFTAFVSSKAPLLVMLLNVLSAVMATIAGARICQSQLATALVQQISDRGVASIKNLKTLANSIIALDNRTQHFMTVREKEDALDALLLHQLSEIRGHCQELKRQTIKIIGDWDDVLPEANLMAQAGTLAHLEQQIALLEEDKKLTEQEVEQSRSKEERTRKLGLEINKREDEIMALRRQVNDKKLELNCSVVGGLGSLAEMTRSGGDLLAASDTLAERTTSQSLERYTRQVEAIEILSSQTSAS